MKINRTKKVCLDEKYLPHKSPKSLNLSEWKVYKIQARNLQIICRRKDAYQTTWYSVSKLP